MKITALISGFNNTKGKVYLMLLDDQEKEIDHIIVEKVSEGMSATFHTEKPGLYAIKVFQDENNNGKLDYNILGLPKEKWGVSNNVKPNFGPPPFKKMLFEVKSDKSLIIKLQ